MLISRKTNQYEYTNAGFVKNKTLRLRAFAAKEMVNKTLVLFIFPTLLFAQQKDTTAFRYSKMISKEDLKGFLTILADDNMEGRETGENGQKMAADFISSQFKSFGIPPYKDSTYYQEFPLNMILPMSAEVIVDGKKYIPKKDYYNFPGQTEQRIEEYSIQFLGYGIEEKNYNDYKGVNVKDKVVMILSGEPYSKDSVSLISGKKTASLWSTYYKVKIEKAKEKGVKALLVIVNDIAKDVEGNKHRLESPSLKLDLVKTEMPIIYISKEMACKILKIENIEKVRPKQKPVKREAKTNLIIDIITNIQKNSSENVLAYIEGSDLKNEVIVISAHYDHLGKEGNIVFNGADDDGSGTVAVMELAKIFEKAKKEGHGPRRSILCMTVSGEEKGLLGSSYYVENPVFPLQNTVCDLNIDMIGRLDEKHANNADYIYLIGSDKLSSQLHSINENANKTYTNLELDYTYNDENDKNRYYYRSDHYNFAKKGIPVIFYFNGVHADYHKPTDDIEKINFEKMEKITRLVFFTAWEVANRNERIVVDSNKK